MGILDSLENQTIAKLGGGSNLLAAGLLQMIQNQPGGLQGLVQSFHDNGLGGVVTSWVGTGPNAPVTSDQVHQVLGGDQIKALAAKAGISSDLAGSAIAQLLPTLVDNLTPNGEVPAHTSVMDMVGGFLRNFEKHA